MPKSSNPPKSDTAAAGDAAPAGSVHNKMAPKGVEIVRGHAIIPKAQIPPVSSIYSRLEPEELSPLLKMEGNQVAENKAAMRELIDKGDERLKADLGASTPSVATLKTLLADLEAAQESRVAAERLAAFAVDKHRVVQNDVRAALRKAEKNLNHEMDDKPGLADDYKALKTLLDQRSEAIVAGIASSRAEKVKKPDSPE